ncbi:hypothetical protein [Xanthomonas theicola]|uniref:hypothetical protein n=1 Tax=Xanthomonas theicola TaxID=56464 RepID=UPI001B803E37|nr:hypothetical protein [Xanthomonas theicola]
MREQCLSAWRLLAVALQKRRQTQAGLEPDQVLFPPHGTGLLWIRQMQLCRRLDQGMRLMGNQERL